MANSQRSMLLFLGICILPLHSSYQPVNLALNGIATQSSEFSSTTAASNAIDGDRGISTDLQSCTHTHLQLNPWWKVDLLAEYNIGTVIITNRGNCCPERLNGAEIHIGNSLIDGGINNPRCASISFIPVGVSEKYKCNIRGRYVSIIIPNVSQYLTLCEVEVYERLVLSKQAFLRIKFNSSEDLTNPTVRDKILQKINSTNVQSSVFQVRWTKQPKLETET